MSARRIDLKFLPEDNRWHAMTVVNGAKYCVRGHHRMAVFFDLCRMLHLPSDSWRIILVEKGHYLCTEIVRTLPRDDLPVTVELKPGTVELKEPQLSG